MNTKGLLKALVSSNWASSTSPHGRPDLDNPAIVLGLQIVLFPVSNVAAFNVDIMVIDVHPPINVAHPLYMGPKLSDLIQDGFR